MTEMIPLRRRMIEDMTVRNLSPATQRSYVLLTCKIVASRDDFSGGTRNCLLHRINSE